MGQVKKTQQQIQNEIDEIHHLLSLGLTDEQIMYGRKDKNQRPIIISRATYYRRKAQLIQQQADKWAKKRDEDYAHEVQLCKERLTRQLNTATTQSNQQGANPMWGVLAAELTASILKADVEGTLAIQHGRLRQLAQKAGYIQYDGSRAEIPTGTPLANTSTNDERQF